MDYTSFMSPVTKSPCFSARRVRTLAGRWKRLAVGKHQEPATVERSWRERRQVTHNLVYDSQNNVEGKKPDEGECVPCGSIHINL